MLPISMRGASGPSLYHPHQPAAGFVPAYFGRMLRFQHMDLEYTWSQMVLLCWRPSQVYKMTAWRKQTKNQWARDDPAFVLVLMLQLLTAAVAYGVAFGASSFGRYLSLILRAQLHLLGFGVLIATSCWWACNKYLLSHHQHSVEQRVEWLYAFDVHCNAFVPFFAILYAAQFVLLPLLLKPGFFPSLLSCLLYVAGFSAYHYISFLGYMHLPFLQQTQYFLAPIAPMTAFFVLLLVLGYNPSRLFLGLFVGQ